MASNRPMVARQSAINTHTPITWLFLKRLIWLAIPFFLVGKANNLQAQEMLRIDPAQVVFEGTELMQEVTLTNFAADTAIYRISFIHYRVTVSGDFEAVEEPDPGQLFASPFLRYYPIQIGLAPGESKRFLLQVRRRDQMEEGEYRSHLLFHDIVATWRAGTEASHEKETQHPSMPVFILQGTTSARAEISEAAILLHNEEPPMLELSISRRGNRSVTGDLTVVLEPPGQEPTIIAKMPGLTIYAPNDLRNVELPLPSLRDIAREADSLVVRFTTSVGSNEKTIPIKQFSPE